MSRVKVLKERRQLADKMKTEEAKKIFGQRKQVVEPAIGNYRERRKSRKFIPKFTQCREIQSKNRDHVAF